MGRDERGKAYEATGQPEPERWLIMKQPGEQGGRRPSPAATPPGSSSSRPRRPPRLRPPGRHHGYFLGAGSPVPLVCITESTTIYLPFANKAAVSGGTLTIFNDSGGGEAVQDGGGQARKGTRGQAENSRGNSTGGKIKGGCKAILTG